ncbi:glucose-1-phosphate thymidylyltransferase RfbA [Prochlorococcus marinus]|uniref:glucose-1-phosphate thymidylyltransferase RfbA n=1 Tax=Prochlorococcus marinus TaxID=1219 RepID=UPI001ADC2F09|nr:glucose-1-phosphate thymidylyltransferase RfbA [Prochlorococcus marinus]MBO8220192.1 glucose-1-phosphate thymidylyltransferase RfbA [Prochlorococcus marinus CUG1417]MBW3074825.1 glucose-1-phosphate thymidylyltransferase [Prochlorococcus marinus str. MU1417]
MIHRKGIILAGGSGTRLSPITNAISKQLVPIYDKPMIYYPLTTLMMVGIKEIMIITTKRDEKAFRTLFKNGNHLGISIKYAIQDNPDGIPQALLIAQEFIGDSPIVLVLGDNIFHGSNLIQSLKEANLDDENSTIFAYPVKDPERYGVVEFDGNYNVLNIEEKPKDPKTNYAVTGLYFYQNQVIKKIKNLKPSKRGELEITDLNQLLLSEHRLKIQLLGRGAAWLDTGTCDSLHEASSFIKIIEQRQGFKIGCPEEVSWRQKWISDQQLIKLSKSLLKSGYGEYLMQLIDSSNSKNKYLLGNTPNSIKS